MRRSLLALSLLVVQGGCAEDPISFDFGVEWTQVPWSGGTLNVALVPPRNPGSGPHPVILALPWGSGSAELVDGFLRAYWLGEAAARGYYVVSPEIRGSDLADTAGEVIPALFAWMEEELDFDPDRVALAGASNGGRGIFFAARAAPERFRALIGLPGSYAGPAGDLAGLVGKPVWLMVGEEDTSWVAAAEETAAKLEEVGASVRLDILPAQGHVLILEIGPLFNGIDERVGR